MKKKEVRVMEAYELEALGLRVFWDTPAEGQDALAHCVHRHSFCEMHILPSLSRAWS